MELIEGRGTTLWPRPGRVFAVSKQYTFERFAVAIDDAFARWDRAHLRVPLVRPRRNVRTRPTRVGDPDSDWDEDRQGREHQGDQYLQADRSKALRYREKAPKSPTWMMTGKSFRAATSVRRLIYFVLR